MIDDKLITFPLYNDRYLRELEISLSENWDNQNKVEITMGRVDSFGELGTIHKVILTEKTTGEKFYTLLVNVTKSAISRYYINNCNGWRDRFYPPEIIEVETKKLISTN